MNISESRWREWRREFPFLAYPDIVDLSSQINEIKVCRMDTFLMEKVLWTQVYHSNSFGKRSFWVKGFVAFHEPCLQLSCVELKVSLIETTIAGERQFVPAPSIGDQLQDILSDPHTGKTVESIDGIVVVSHDDDAYNGNVPLTTMIIYKPPRKGTRELLDAYWISIQKAISSQIALADLVD